MANRRVCGETECGENMCGEIGAGSYTRQRCLSVASLPCTFYTLVAGAMDIDAHSSPKMRIRKEELEAANHSRTAWFFLCRCPLWDKGARSLDGSGFAT